VRAAKPTPSLAPPPRPSTRRPAGGSKRLPWE
jgi:hypothetical protein